MKIHLIIASAAAIIPFAAGLAFAAGDSPAPQKNKILNVGHRGASGYAPENTMSAFKLAKEMGADMVELDVYRTKDGVLVVMHDADVKRTTDGEGKIEEMMLEQVKKLDAGSRYNPKFAGEKIPALDEVLEWAVAADIQVNIEIKGAGCEELVLAAIEKYKMRDKIIVSSFHHDYIKKIEEADPGIKTGALVKDIEDIDAIIAASGKPDAVNPRYNMVTKQIVDEAHKRGLAVNVYTVNDPLAMRQMISAGVDSIITNYPDRLGSLINKKKKAGQK